LNKYAAAVTDFWMLGAVSSREQLAEALSHRSDSEINELASGTDLDHVLAHAFVVLQQGFRPEITVDDHGTVQWDIITPVGIRQYTMTLEAGIFEVKAGVPPSPRVMLGLNLPDFLRLAAGQLDGMQAFLAGRLRLSGDLLFAQKLWEGTGSSGVRGNDR
jgi:hypothetical protein